MLDAVMYVVLFRTFSRGKEMLLKARPSGWTEEDLPRPVKGERYLVCNSLLSKVQIIRDIPGGYEVCTENSRYKVYLMTSDELGKVLESGGWALDRISQSGSLYYRRV